MERAKEQRVRGELKNQKLWASPGVKPWGLFHVWGIKLQPLNDKRPTMGQGTDTVILGCGNHKKESFRVRRGVVNVNPSRVDPIVHISGTRTPSLKLGVRRLGVKG
jgi:hypothetical protein